MDNAYLCPPESKGQYKLDCEWGGHAIDQLFKTIDSGSAPTIKYFEDQVCKTMKLMQTFVKARERKYGKIATESKAWQNIVLDMKANMQTRRLVTEGLKENHAIEASLPDVKIICAEFDPQFKEGLAKAKEANCPAVADAPDAPNSEQAVENMMIETWSSKIDFDSNDVPVQVGSALDPLPSSERIATTRANIVMERVKYGDGSELLPLVKDWCTQNPTSTILAVIDAASAASVVQTSLIKQVKALLPSTQPLRMLVLAGPSLSALAAAEREINNVYPSSGVFFSKIASKASTSSPASGGRSLAKARNITYAISEWVAVAKDASGLNQNELFTKSISCAQILHSSCESLRKICTNVVAKSAVFSRPCQVNNKTQTTRITGSQNLIKKEMHSSLR